MDAKQERDTWTGMQERRKRELMAAGMSAEDADQQAADEVRREMKRCVWPLRH